MSDHYETTLMNRWNHAGDGASQWALNEIERLRAALEEIAEYELGYEGQVARKALNPDD